MKIAVVNQYSNAGGGARFVRALVTAMAGVSPDSEITLFADASAVERDGLDSLFSGQPNIKVERMGNGLAAMPPAPPRSTPLRRFAKRIPLLARVYYRHKAKQAEKEAAWFDFAMDDDTIAHLCRHDVVHFAWPYFIEPARIDAPVVVTMHDFNFKYPFRNFSDRMLALVEAQTPRWLQAASEVVVSAEFMRQELLKFYPDSRTPVSIVRLTHFSITEHGENDVETVLAKFELAGPYMICASNTSRHKNIEGVIRAAGALKARGIRIPLVLAGSNTEHIGQYAGSDFPPDHPLAEFERLSTVVEEAGLEVGRDIRPLGYVSDSEIDALIRAATLVVAPSLYEAGSGPALDAWVAGTPVAFSDIAPFQEHLEFLGTEAFVFDPSDPADIANVLQAALEDPANACAMAERSQEAIARYTWRDVAAGYLSVYAHVAEKAAQ